NSPPLHKSQRLPWGGLRSRGDAPASAVARAPRPWPKLGAKQGPSALRRERSIPFGRPASRGIVTGMTMEAPAGASALGAARTTSSEEIIWEGQPTWKAWALRWILGWVLLPILVGAFLLVPVWLHIKSKRWKITSLRIE